MSTDEPARRTARARSAPMVAVMVGVAGAVAAGLGVTSPSGRDASPPAIPADARARFASPPRAPAASFAAREDDTRRAVDLPPPPLPSGPALEPNFPVAVGAVPATTDAPEDQPRLDPAVRTSAVIGRPSTLDRVHVLGVTHRHAEELAVLLTGKAAGSHGPARAELWRIVDGRLAHSYLRLRIEETERALGLADLGPGPPGVLLLRGTGMNPAVELRVLRSERRWRLAELPHPAPEAIVADASSRTAAVAWRAGGACSVWIGSLPPTPEQRPPTSVRDGAAQVLGPDERVRATDAWAGPEGAAAGCLLDAQNGTQRVRLRWTAARGAVFAAATEEEFEVHGALGVQMMVHGGRPLVVVEVTDGLRVVQGRGRPPVTLELPGGGAAVVGHELLGCGGRAWIFVAIEDGQARAVTALAFPLSAGGEPGAPILVGARRGMVPSAAGRAAPRAAAGCDEPTAYAVWSSTDGVAQLAAWTTH